MSNGDPWTIEFGDEKTEDRVKSAYESSDTLKKKWARFEVDVISNPFFHPKPRRIVKMRGKKSLPPGTYRYRNDPIRVVYYPNKEEKAVYPLECSTTTDVSYKKRTSK